MKNVPEKIYLQIDADGETPEDFKELSGVCWCANKVFNNDIEYVLSTPCPECQEKDREIVRLKELIEAAYSSAYNTGYMDCRDKVENKANPFDRFKLDNNL